VRIFLRLVFVAIFLLTQTAGVAHQAWHDGAQAAHSSTDDGKPPKKNLLCDFHTALGSVLGALANADLSPQIDLQDKTQIAAADSRAARFSLLASRSRGPPAFL
jgi:hypothetical protein